MGLRMLGRLALRAVKRFDEQGGMRHGAALAFYATLSLAPLVLLAVSLLSLVPRSGEVERLITERLPLLIGQGGTEVVQAIVEAAPDRSGGLWGLAGSLVLLAFGGSVFFVNVQGVLDDLWNVRQPDRGIVKGFLRNRLSALTMMAATGAILLGSTLLGAAAAWIGPRLENLLPLDAGVVTGLELAISGVVLTGLCAASYRILPAVDIAWRDVVLGAVLTTVLFLVGRTAIGWYLARAAGASRFGAAGSLVVFLMWVYYSAQIFLLGAEFTQVHAEERGAPLRPEPGARRVERTTVVQSEAD